MQSTGSLIVDGVVQIIVAHVGHNTIDAERVPDLMKNVSKTLIECIQDAASAFPGDVAAPVVVQRAVSAPAARLPAPAKAVTAPEPAPQPAPPAAETNVVDLAKATSKASRKAAAAPKAAASEPAVAKVAAKAETAKSAAPAPAAKPKTPAYRFAHLSKTPAVPIDDSITAEGIVCLFDGSPRKMLHRYIKSKYGMTPEEYRTHWNLPKDYPMTAPGYSDEKRTIAMAQGLGTTKQTRNTKKRAQAAAKARQRQSA